MESETNPDSSRSPSPCSEDKTSEEISTKLLRAVHLKHPKTDLPTTESSKRQTPELISTFSVASLLAGTKSHSPRPTLWSPSDFYMPDPHHRLESSLSPGLKSPDICVPVSEMYLMDRILDGSHPGYLGPHHARIPHPLPGVWASGRAHLAGQRPMGPPPTSAGQWAAAISLQAANPPGKMRLF
ncbi:hypothetical protein JTE90_002328 [Oedothorax gibbosus]|uniref:Uncharacterized protein n=1 Tax=Oedothorax gibbosus TaxID=931172 RepID=A0AAV6ULH8_9ARAC|nr:hypothetical protein JTE90_002328 [Oedothorax gibbosus]